MGKISTPEEFKVKYEVDEVLFSDGLEGHLRSEAASKPLLLNKGKNSDSGSTYEPPKLPAFADLETDEGKLFPVLCDSRVFKSPKEVSRSEGHTIFTTLRNIAI